MGSILSPALIQTPIKFTSVFQQMIYIYVIRFV